MRGRAATAGRRCRRIGSGCGRSTITSCCRRSDPWSPGFRVRRALPGLPAPAARHAAGRHAAPGSPFGRSVVALLADLPHHHAIACERLGTRMAALFGLAISEGAIANALKRPRAVLARATEAITARRRRAGPSAATRPARGSTGGRRGKGCW